MKKPRIMVVVPDDLIGLQKKGVASKILERDEEGFFERVVSVHPLGLEDKITQFNAIHILHEMHLKFRTSQGLRKIWATLNLPTFLILAVYKLVRIVKNERVSIIRANDPYWIGFLGVLLKKITGIPLCISIHSDYDHCYQLKGSGNSYSFLGFRWPVVLLSRYVFKQADMVLPIRDSLARWAILYGARFESIRVIPHGIDLTPFTKREISAFLEKFQIPSDKKILSFVGRISKENYIDDVIMLVKDLSKIRRDFVLVVAGGGVEEERVRSIVAKDDIIKDIVVFLGFQPKEVVYALRMGSTISLCLMGGFSLIEACAAGKPVISYDVEWHNELVKNNETGFLVREHDISALTSNSLYVLDHPIEAIRMAEKARTLAFERHDIQNTLRIKRACYSELLQMRSI